MQAAFEANIRVRDLRFSAEQFNEFFSLYETVCRGQADKTLVGKLDNIFGEILEGLKPDLPYSEWKKGAEVRLWRSVLGEKVSNAEVLEFSSQ